MGNKKVWALLMLGWFISGSTVNALQIKKVSDNQLALGSISTNALTKIAVEDDRISNIKGPDGVYLIKNDLIEGSVYLKPQNPRDRAPFILFVSTESGGHFMLRLTPTVMASDTILLKEQGGHQKVAEHFEKSMPYLDTLSVLIDDMVHHVTPEGYGVRLVKGKRQWLREGLRSQCLTRYEGANLTGEVFLIQNRSGQIVYLTEKDFNESGVRAVALLNTTLPPKSETFLYRVVRHG
jgi:type-F conjugative transfer system secretin TraK